MRYSIELNGNPNYLTVHLDKRISDNPYMETYFEPQDNMPQERVKLLTDLFAIDGIKEVSIRRFEIAFVRGVMFDRMMLGRQIAVILHRHFEPNGEIEEVPMPSEYEEHSRITAEDRLEDGLSDLTHCNDIYEAQNTLLFNEEEREG